MRIGLGFKRKISNPFAGAIFSFGYRDTESANTLIEARLATNKDFLSHSVLPIRLSGTAKWRKQERQNGSSATDVGGSLSVRMSLHNKISVNVIHSVEDDISAAGTSFIGKLNTKYGHHLATFIVSMTEEGASSLSVGVDLDWKW